MEDILKYSKISNDAYDLVKGTEDSAGFDLKSAYNYIIPPKSRVKVHTGISIKLPDDCYGQIFSRSGLALKGLDVKGGVIDKDYRGSCDVILYNNNDFEYPIKSGDRIAQLVPIKISYPKLLHVESLDKTERGDKGFGSTGT